MVEHHFLPDDTPPVSDHLTDYDRRHAKLYLRLLDAAAENADWREVAGILFGIDAGAEPDRARRVYDAHLERARWMTRKGYRELVDWGWPQ